MICKYWSCHNKLKGNQTMYCSKRCASRTYTDIRTEKGKPKPNAIPYSKRTAVEVETVQLNPVIYTTPIHRYGDNNEINNSERWTMIGSSSSIDAMRELAGLERENPPQIINNDHKFTGNN